MHSGTSLVVVVSGGVRERIKARERPPHHHHRRLETTRETRGECACVAGVTPAAGGAAASAACVAVTDPAGPTPRPRTDRPYPHHLEFGRLALARRIGTVGVTDVVLPTAPWQSWLSWTPSSRGLTRGPHVGTIAQAPAAVSLLHPASCSGGVLRKQ